MRLKMTASTQPIIVDRRRTWMFVAAGGAVAIAALAWLIVSFMSGGEPRLNENTVVLTKFVRSRQFDALPFDKQRQFYKVLDDRGQELDQAYTDHRLTEAEYRAGLEAGWLGKHIKHVEK